MVVHAWVVGVRGWGLKGVGMGSASEWDFRAVEPYLMPRNPAANA